MNHEKGGYTPTLTVREWDVFWMAIARLSNQEIADTLQISVATVKTHKRFISCALGVNGRTGITDWYAENRTTAARLWLETISPGQAAADAAQGGRNTHNDNTVYRLLTDTADRRGSVSGAVHYANSLPPLVAAFINCHLELMHLSGVIVDHHDDPGRPHLAGGVQPQLTAAQDEALDRQDGAGLELLSQQLSWARASALGVLAATEALLGKVNERMAPFGADPEPGLPRTINGIVETLRS